jgi:hypothetical protein
MADNDSELSGCSVADLLKQASDQTATLVRQEVEQAGGRPSAPPSPGCCNHEN